VLSTNNLICFLIYLDIISITLYLKRWIYTYNLDNTCPRPLSTLIDGNQDITLQYFQNEASLSVTSSLPNNDFQKQSFLLGLPVPDILAIKYVDQLELADSVN